MEEALEKFLETAGILGPIVVFLGWYVWTKDKQIKELLEKLEKNHEARTRDAQEVQDALLKFNTTWSEALNANTAAMGEIKTLLVILRERTSRRPPPIPRG